MKLSTVPKVSVGLREGTAAGTVPVLHPRAKWPPVAEM